MKKKPLVSIVMNCHNGGKYLKESITSIVKQTYKNWELIFWNNNSTDNSKEIFNKLREKRFRYFESSKLKNLYESRNLAVSKCKGKYVCFLDTDDWWVKSKLYQQINLFEKDKNLKFIYSNLYQFNQKSKKKYLFSKTKLPSGKITQQLLKDYRVGIVTVMLKRELFKKNKFNKNYNIIGDFDFFIRLSRNEIIKCIQKPLAYYRLHSSNYSKLKLDLYLKEIDSWIKINKKKFENKNYSLFSLRIIKYKIKVKNLLNFFNLKF